MALVKKEMARAVEDSVIRAATNGQLKGKVTEPQLITMLEQISGSESAETSAPKKKITVQRRKYDMDDDDDDNDDDFA